MNIAAIFLIAILLMPQKREGCQTTRNKEKETNYGHATVNHDHGVNAYEQQIRENNDAEIQQMLQSLRSKPCGEALVDYDEMKTQYKPVSAQKKIENVLPWTVLVEFISKSDLFDCMGVLLEDNIVAVGLCHKSENKQNQKTHQHSDTTIKVFAAKDVDKNGPKKFLDFVVTKPIQVLSDAAHPDDRLGSILKVPSDLTTPITRPICLPKNHITRTTSDCLVAGWKIESSGDRRTFEPEVIEVKISADAECKTTWSDYASLDGICVESEKFAEIDVAQFAFGPLVCYDSLSVKKVWSLHGLPSILMDAGEPPLFTNVFKHELIIQNAINKLNK